MHLNKKNLIDKFSSYLDSISYFVDSNLNLTSFAFEIQSIEISKLLTSKIANNDYFYWQIEDYRIEFLAISPLKNFYARGDDRLKDTYNKIRNYEVNFRSNWSELKLKSVPLVVGGIKFSPNQKSDLWKEFNDSDWFIPKLLFLKKDDKFYLVYNFINSSNNSIVISEFQKSLNEIENIELPEYSTIYDRRIKSPIYSNSVDKWGTIVNKALKNISEGLLSKVVLSREVKFKLEDEQDIGQLLSTLAERYPKCYTFAFKRKESIFFGATPEKLAKISGNWIEVDALAGSAPRGEDQAQDMEMEKFLLNSEKNLFEQRAVVNFIHNLLTKFSEEIIFDDKPMIRKLPNIQHLWTIIRARLNQNFKIFELLMKLHPTPAICGDPWKVAKNFILENEPHDRGLYSGNIGWFNFNNDGEFAVGIRTALLKENEVYAYAGCGIVAGSEAIAEFEESEIKLKPILSLFADEKVYQS